MKVRVWSKVVEHRYLRGWLEFVERIFEGIFLDIPHHLRWSSSLALIFSCRSLGMKWSSICIFLWTMADCFLMIYRPILLVELLLRNELTDTPHSCLLLNQFGAWKNEVHGSHVIMAKEKRQKTDTESQAFAFKTSWECWLPWSGWSFHRHFRLAIQFVYLLIQAVPDRSTR